MIMWFDHSDRPHCALVVQVYLEEADECPNEALVQMLILVDASFHDLPLLRKDIGKRWRVLANT
jgi:hypothetical protein